VIGNAVKFTTKGFVEIRVELEPASGASNGKLAFIVTDSGEGMSEEQVVKFVDAYYPAYELFSDGVREGVFKGKRGREGCQLRVVVGRGREVVESMVI
jgi:K+-sensing histidine kinase KdpD